MNNILFFFWLIYTFIYRIIKHLGAGQFGTVSKGIWESHYGSIEVAVKMLQPQASDEEKLKFLQESAIMGQFLHPNIVKLHGVVTVDQPVMNENSACINGQHNHIIEVIVHELHNIM